MTVPPCDRVTHPSLSHAHAPSSQDLFKKYGVSILSSVFDNTDKQNVPAAVNLLEGFGQVRLVIAWWA